MTACAARFQSSDPPVDVTCALLAGHLADLDHLAQVPLPAGGLMTVTWPPHEDGHVSDVVRAATRRYEAQRPISPDSGAAR